MTNNEKLKVVFDFIYYYLNESNNETTNIKNEETEVKTNGNVLNGFWLEVKRSKNNFIIKKTVAITYPNSTSCTNDSVANNTVVGIAIVNDKLVSYQAKLS